MAGRLELVSFAVDGRRLGLELGVVERVVAMVAISPLARAPDAVLGAVDVGGTIVPVYDLRRRLGLPAREYGPDASLLLVRTANRMVAVPADEVDGVRTVEAPADAEAVVPGLEHVAGLATLDDGLLMIQDLDDFLTTDEERQLAEACAD
jgi:purine-binding chemotaxis protein CheW